MTKAQQEKAERLLLESYIKTNPQIKTFLDELLKKDKKGNVELNDIIQPVIEDKLKQARIIGTQIGWKAAFIRCEEAIKDMSTVEEIQHYIHGEANKVRKTLGLKGKV